MKSLSLEQGSQEWHAHRATHFNASDAAAMLGCSPYMTRSELLHAIHTGIRPEPPPDLQRRYDRGHEIEAAKRPVAEAILGEDLYPVVGCEGELSASFDGLTMLHDANWECKSLNADLRAALPNVGPDDNDAASLPKMYRAQMEQQCLVSGATRVLFTASDGYDDDRHCWYTPDAGLRAEIVAGWKQFAEDLAAYKPPAAVAVIVAAPVQALPAVTVQVSGTIMVQENFAVFETAMRDFLEHRLIREPKTDQDFADLDVQIKAMKGAEAALKSAEAQMLAQVEPIYTAKATKDMLLKLVSDNRIMAEKLLASEKERRRGEIVTGGASALREHVAALNTRLGKAYMPQSYAAADFAGAIKGMRSLASMEDAVATLLANSKIAANDVADRVDANLKQLRELARGYETLFADTSTLVLKAPDDCKATITSRISEHKAAEAERLEKERERIRAEEAERIEREQQAARQAELRREQEASEALKPAPTPAPATIAAPAPVVQAAAANVVPLGTRAPASEPATLKLGEINARLGFTMTAEFVATVLGISGQRERGAVLFKPSDYDRIRAALVQHIEHADHAMAA